MIAPMPTRFMRLSVIAGERQLDASFPASRPIAEFLAHVPAMFSLRPTTPPTAWTLSTPQHGILAPNRSLDDAGILDGDVLYLSPALSAAETPVVDDVLAALSERVEGRMAPWRGADRDRVTSCLIGAVGLAIALTLAALSDALVSGASLFVTGVLVFAVGAVRGRGGLANVAWLSPLYAVLAALAFTGGASRIPAAAAAGLLALAGVAALRRVRQLLAGALVAAVFAAVAAIPVALGASAAAVAGWTSPVLVLALGVLPQLALATSGLVGLVRRGEQDDAVPRAQVVARIDATTARIEGAVAAIGAAGAVSTAILVSSDRSAQAALGLLLGLVFALRSRYFAAATQVGYLLAAAVAALVAAAVALPTWTGLTTPPASAGLLRLAGLVVVASIVATGGYVRLRDLEGARLTRMLDILDTVAVVALVPAVLLAQGLFTWAAHQM